MRAHIGQVTQQESYSRDCSDHSTGASFAMPDAAGTAAVAAGTAAVAAGHSNGGSTSLADRREEVTSLKVM